MYLDQNLKSNLDLAKEGNTKEFDCVCVLFGGEGAGKSRKAQQIAKYWDNSFNIDDIAFTPEEFAKKVREAAEYKCIIFDEARTGFNRKRTMSLINKILSDLLTVIRSRKLFIILCIPDLFDLDSFIVEWRLRFAIRVYTKKFERGYFKFYSKKRIKQLSIFGRKTKNYYCAKPNFIGRFTNFKVIDDKEYNRRKNKATEDIGSFETSSEDRVAELMAKISILAKEFKIPQNTVSERLGVSTRTLQRAKKALNSKNEEAVPNATLTE